MTVYAYVILSLLGLTFAAAPTIERKMIILIETAIFIPFIGRVLGWF